MIVAFRIRPSFKTKKKSLICQGDACILIAAFCLDPRHIASCNQLRIFDLDLHQAIKSMAPMPVLEECGSLEDIRSGSRSCNQEHRTHACS